MKHHPDEMRERPSRRDLLKQASAALVVVSTSSADASADTSSPDVSSKFQPQEYWEERMKAPDDGKRYGWFIDTRRCFGCHACEVSCKAENDVPLGNFIRQTIYKDVGEYPKVARMFLPMACQHCEDAPCLKACPCGALHKEAGGTVAVNYDICCGHATCVEVCPYGAIYLDPVAKQAVKCHNCYHRTEGPTTNDTEFNDTEFNDTASNDADFEGVEGINRGPTLEPACATTCPSDAIYFGDLNDPRSKVAIAKKEAEEADDIQQLRPEKNTKPRMWFRGPGVTEIEDRVPREGKSYSHEAYNIYNWKEAQTESKSND